MFRSADRSHVDNAVLVDGVWQKPKQPKAISRRAMLLGTFATTATITTIGGAHLFNRYADADLVVAYRRPGTRQVFAISGSMSWGAPKIEAQLLDPDKDAEYIASLPLLKTYTNALVRAVNDAFPDATEALVDGAEKLQAHMNGDNPTVEQTEEILTAIQYAQQLAIPELQGFSNFRSLDYALFHVESGLRNVKRAHADKAVGSPVEKAVHTVLERDHQGVFNAQDVIGEMRQDVFIVEAMLEFVKDPSNRLAPVPIPDPANSQSAALRSAPKMNRA